MTTSDTSTRRGAIAAICRDRGVPCVTMAHTLTAPSDWDTFDAVPLSTVARTANVPSGDLRNAVRRGLLHPTQERGKFGVSLIPKDEAVGVLTAVAISAAAGVVFATALRVALAGATLPGTDAAA